MKEDNILKSVLLLQDIAVELFLELKDKPNFEELLIINAKIEGAKEVLSYLKNEI